MHESLSHELKSFGIKVLIVEPGAFRTPFSSRVLTPAGHADNGGFSEAYRGTPVEQLLTLTCTMGDIPNFVKGDPEKAARAVLEAVDGGHGYLRLPLGPDSVAALEEKLGQLNSDLSATRALASSTNVDE